jgi:hypothetical protein
MSKKLKRACVTRIVTFLTEANAAGQYVVASALARCASDANFDRICLYANCLPTEFRVLCVRDATLRAPGIHCTAGYTKWAVENHHAIA